MANTKLLSEKTTLASNNNKTTTTMGKGGQTQKAAESAVPPSKDTPSTKQTEEEWVSPFTPALFADPKTLKERLPTKGELRAIIPKHCFERSLPRSMFYVIRDCFMGFMVCYITHSVVGLKVDPPHGFFQAPLQWLVWRLAWNVYAFVMTMPVFGLWVLAHECGHGAFSKYKVVNGTIGWIFHSLVLVPYFSWAFSHAKHHRRVNDMIEGETHIPPLGEEFGLKPHKDTKGEYTYERLPKSVVDKELYGGSMAQFGAHLLYGSAGIHDAMGDEGFAIYMVFSRLFAGWQIYLTGIESNGMIGADGKIIGKETFPDHFRPHSRLFPAKMFWKVVLSDIGVFGVIAALIYFSYQYSFRAVWMWYFGPYMLTNVCLITVTYLHHTDPSVPHFDADNWSWVKGVLAGTIDRPLNGWMNWCSHNISTTHIVHHLFHEIPHYHAVEATKAIREYLEPKGLYNYDPTPVTFALWKVCKRCHFVDSHFEGVQYYKSLEDIPRTQKAKQL